MKTVKRLTMFFVALTLVITCAVALAPDAKALPSDWRTYTIPDSETVTNAELYYTIQQNKVVIEMCSADVAGDLVIPGTIDGYKVDIIGDTAFQNCTALETVSIPNTVYTIGRGAFRGCSSLHTLYLPGSVREIDFFAFENCPKLTRVNYMGSANQFSGIQILYDDEVECALLWADVYLNWGGKWFQQGGKWLYRKVDGNLMTGLDVIGSDIYYFNANGVMHTGWLGQGELWIYFDPVSGALVTDGWKQIGGKWYYFTEEGYIATQWAIIDGQYNKFTNDGVWLGVGTGWLQIEDKWVYFDANGMIVTGWKYIGGSWYYFDQNCVMVTGFRKIGNDTYYFNKSGKMVTGWVDEGPGWHYFDLSGKMVTGEHTIDGKLHDFNEYGEWLGEIKIVDNGWVKKDFYWYYYQNGTTVKGWKLIDGVWYYFDEETKMVTGWREINGEEYYFNSSGAMQTGWKQRDRDWFYLSPSGAKVTGEYTVDGELHIFDDYGVWQGRGEQKPQLDKKGWVFEYNNWYYYREGLRVKGWNLIGGTWYYMDASGIMQTGWINIESTRYYLDNNGAMKTGWVYVESWMYSDVKEWFYLDSSGAMYTGWLQQGNKWYYLNRNGVMLTGTQMINGQTQRFDNSGAWIP